MPAFCASAWKNSRTSSVSNVPIFGEENATFQTRNGRPETSTAARGQRLVHGKVERGIARDAAPLAERLGNRLADRNAGVLDRVVVVDVQVALGLDRHVDQRMARQLLQHVVEEADAGRDVEAAGAVDIDGDRDRGLLGLAADLRRCACVTAIGDCSVQADRARSYQHSRRMPEFA